MEGKIKPISKDVFDTLCLDCEKVFDTPLHSNSEVCPVCSSKHLVWANEFGRNRFGQLTYISIHGPKAA